MSAKALLNRVITLFISTGLRDESVEKNYFRDLCKIIMDSI